MEWYKCILPLRDPDTLDSETFKDMEDAMLIQIDDDIFGVDWLDGFVTEIRDSKYDVTSALEVAEKQTHLTTQQQQDLQCLFQNMKNCSAESLECINTSNSM